jgi:ABC-type bacteriocin/lantibiotic exporter with double-glycine peptidase domain
MRNIFGIQPGDIIRIIFAVIIVMLIYNFLLFMVGIAKTIIIVILIYIVYKIVKAIL